MLELALVASYGLLLASLVAAHHTCVQSQLPLDSPLVSSTQFYDDHPFENATRRLTVEMDAAAMASTSLAANALSVYKNIRITPIFDTTSLNALSTAKSDFIRTKLVADAIDFWGQTLSVVPISGAWFAERNCIHTWQTSTPVCNKVESDQMCFEQPIPDSHFAPLKICSTCYSTNCASPSDSCTATPSGPGVADTDYVLYVRTVQTSNCGSNVLAYATSCQLDQFDRPTMGMVNFCPLKLNPDPAVYDKQLDTATHEIAHALGFSAQMYAFMRNPDGSPRTPRDSTGQPPVSVSYKCPNGVVSSAVQMPSQSTVQFFTERGHSVAKLVTPNVLAFARAYFNCPTLNGAEIEDQDGGCLGSHWEERIFEPELMSPLQSYRNPVSGLTLSYFQDSGWYQVNFSSAEPMYWGANRGCPFAYDSCIQASVATPSDHFCVDASVDSCSVDLTSRGVCTIRKSASSVSIPIYDQYFSDPQVGGASFPDFCPLYTGFMQGDCWNASNLQTITASKINLLGEIYSPASFCLKSTLLTNDNKGWAIPGRATGCYAASCGTGGAVTVQIATSSGSVQATCNQKGQAMTIPGFSGSLFCPDPSIVCGGVKCSPACGPNSFCSAGQCACLDGYVVNATSNACVPICPNACSGNGVCNVQSAKCTCNSGYSGTDCSTTSSTKSSSARQVAAIQVAAAAAVVVAILNFV
ncbi:hypothetical protein LEN26_005736 [Aphanomyces euteiches]|nr:hypothetical protein LEN26_005736 [Aphanomyces euteiches]